MSRSNLRKFNRLEVLSHCCAAVVLAMCTFTAAASGGSSAVWVAPARVDAQLESIGLGYAEWLRQQLSEVGLEIAGPLAVESTRGAGLSDLSSQIRSAAHNDADFALLSRLRSLRGEIEIALALYSSDSGEIVAASRARSPLATPGMAFVLSLGDLLDAAGAAAEVNGPAPLLGELSVMTRALAKRDAGELCEAWRELRGRLSPMAMRLRQDLAATARDSGAPIVDRAVVMAASGEPETAWRLIQTTVDRESQKSRPDLRTLVAAGEIKLALRDPREARRFFEAALRRDSNYASAQLGLGRALTDQNDVAHAREALERAARLSPEDPTPLKLLADIADEQATQARWLLRAGNLSAERLDIGRASRLIDRARSADPALASDSWLAMGNLHTRLGRPAQALEAYQRARSTGAGDNNPEVHKGAGRAYLSLGDLSGATSSFERAIELEGDDIEALQELGAIYNERGLSDAAIPLLESAMQKSGGREDVRRSLARAKRDSGDSEGALEVLGGIESSSSESLRELAEIHRSRDDLDAARSTLEGAIRLEPQDPRLRSDLAVVLEAQSDPARAERERGVATLLAASPSDALGSATGYAAQRDPEPLRSLAQTFSNQFTNRFDRNLSLLQVRGGTAWMERALYWLHPRAPAFGDVRQALETSLAERFPLAEAQDDHFAELEDEIDALHRFEASESLGADNIAAINSTLDTGAVFAARMLLAPSLDERETPCTDGEFEVEVRMLSGQEPDFVSILMNRRCLPSDAGPLATWNVRAAGCFAALALLMVFPLVRGWGSLVVKIALPPRTKGFFSVRVSKRPDDMPLVREPGEKWPQRTRRFVRSLSRYELHMVGRESIFRWIPARRRSYTVTVRGPLLDSRGDKIIGHFLEQQTVRVTRGGAQQIEYDFRPKECAVEVSANRSGEPLSSFRVSVKGDASSLRYGKEGRVFLYLGTGTHTLLVGAQDRVAVCEIPITSLESSVPVAVNLDNENQLAFQGCPEAVEPYLSGDFATAVDILEAAGRSEAAHRLRGALHRDRGDFDRAADELKAGGQLEEAAALRASGSDLTGSAELFEEAGDLHRAAEAYRDAGAFASAARCFESSYAFDDAIECYRSTGDIDKVVDLLEKSGEYLEAATLAFENGDEARSVTNLQQIGTREDAYPDACSLFSQILCEKGDFELAAEKLAEAMSTLRGGDPPVEMMVRRAQCLDRAGLAEQAIEAYDAIRLRDPGRSDVATRVTVLRRELETITAPEPSDPPRAQAEADVESRYEILGEIGRGGMGVVLKARDRRLGRLVALKRLPDSLRYHPVAIELFHREARAAAALNHRNIVTIFDADEENESYFITMELLEGQPLNAILSRRGILSPADVARLGLQICAGLAYAHHHQIVHRDIKTANLFVTADRVVKIMDFGLAKMIEEVRRTSTMIGGTPSHMAPEQAAGKTVDHRTDLYSLGVTFFELATGSVPFPDGDPAYHHRHTPAPDPRELSPTLPGALAQLILAMLEKRREDRPADANAVTARLQPILNALS